MDVHRIEGIKHNFDRFTDAELVSLRDHLLDRQTQLMGEIALVQHRIFDRGHDQLPLDTGEANYEHLLGRACIEGEITATDAVQALDNYHG